jgi:hypothetical protein
MASTRPSHPEKAMASSPGTLASEPVRVSPGSRVKRSTKAATQRSSQRRRLSPSGETPYL